MDEKERDELIAKLMADYKSPEDLLGPGGLLKQLTGALVERGVPQSRVRMTVEPSSIY